MINDEIINSLEKVICYEFKNKALIFEALTHSSYANERKINKISHNERLEFLGDAVLEMISSDFLFRKYGMLNEGQLSKLRAALVCEDALAKSAKMINLGDCIFLGKGEESHGGRTRASVTSDACEALIGAMYLDGGLEPVTAFIMKYVLYDTDSFLNNIDSKSRLQECIQATDNKAVIVYNVIEESGPEHDKLFVVEVTVNGERKGIGSGRNKKNAEKEAALQAIKNIQN